MRKERLKNLSTESLNEQRSKILKTLRIIITISIIVLSFYFTRNRLVEINIIHMIVAGAVIGGIIELIVNAAMIRRELKERDISNF
jgi:predicted membrane protein